MLSTRQGQQQIGTSMMTKQSISSVLLTLLFLTSCKEEVSLSSVNKPVYYTWEIHIHNIVAPDDSVAFDNICEGLRRTAKIFENHNIRVNWGVMQDFAEAVVKYQTSENNIFIELENMGHEIAGHSWYHLTQTLSFPFERGQGKKRIYFVFHARSQPSSVGGVRARAMTACCLGRAKQ